MSLTRFLMINVHAPARVGNPAVAKAPWSPHRRASAADGRRLLDDDRSAVGRDDGAGRVMAWRDFAVSAVRVAACGVPRAQPHMAPRQGARPAAARQYRADLSVRSGWLRAVSCLHGRRRHGDARRYGRPAGNRSRTTRYPHPNRYRVAAFSLCDRLDGTIHAAVDAARAGCPSRLDSIPQWALVMGCAATLGLLAAGGTSEFLYFRF
jgi:hypothetical protein